MLPDRVILYLWPAGGAGAFSLTLNDGSAHYVTGNITLNPAGTFTQNGGDLFYGTFTQAGGTVNGDGT